MKKRFTEEQIIGILKEAEAGMKVADVIRKHGISCSSFDLIVTVRSVPPRNLSQI